MHERIFQAENYRIIKDESGVTLMIPKVEIKEMPTKELLEDFLMGFYGEVNVVFNRWERRFERVGDGSET